jgi:hypothetical protein
VTDVFYIKEGSTSPSISTTLLDSNNNPADVSEGFVTFRMSGPDEVSGAASFVSDGTDGQVYYEWAADDLAAWGGYAAEWVYVADDVTEIFPGAGYNWVEVMPTLTSVIGGVCTLLDVRRAMGRSLTDAESVRAVSLILSLTAVLERRLNRVFETREITETHRIGGGGLVPYKHPVLAVNSITVDDAPWTADLAGWDIVTWPIDSAVTITYTAGTEVDAGVKDVVANAIARTLQVAPVVASGAIQSYSVEGTAITYGNVAGTEQGSVGRLTVGDIGGLARLKVPVWRQ